MDYYMDIVSGVGIKLPVVVAIGVITFLFFLLHIICWWKIFAKTDEPAWMSVVPFLHTFKVYEIACGNGWFMLIFLIPVAGWIYNIIIMHKLSKAFGYNILLTLLFIFMPTVAAFILAFGNNDYYGPY